MDQSMIDNRFKTVISEFGGTFSLICRGKVFCNFCATTVIFRKTQNLRKHIKTKKHIDNAAGNKTFYEDLCEAFISANIPLRKMNNPIFRQFIRKYTGIELSDEATVRRNFVKGQYEKTICKIRSKIETNNIWVSSDVIIDSKGRSVVNVVVGVLNSQYYDPYLISCQFRSNVIAEEIALIIRSAILNIANTENDKVLLFVSDDNATMLEVGVLLKRSYTNMLHTTCFCSSINKICELIYRECQDLNNFILNFEKILKTPSFQLLYQEKCSGLPLPPEINLTKMCTWLNATVFYAENIYVIKEFILELSNDDVCIKECKIALDEPNILQNLSFVTTNFSQILTTLKFFEQQNLELKNSFFMIESLFERLKMIDGSIGEKLKAKIDEIIERCPDFTVLKQIANNSFEDRVLREKYSKSVPDFYFAPVTMSEVERTFVRLKDLLTFRRNKFSEENLEKYLIIQSFLSVDKKFNDFKMVHPNPS